MNQKESFCESIRQCEKSMYTLAYGILKNEHDAADVIQESILKAYCNYDRLKNPQKFKQWMLKIVYNTSIDFIHKRFDGVDIEQHEYLVSKEADVDNETKIVLWEAIKKIRLPYRMVLILYYYEDYSVLQISQIMSTSITTVRQHLSRGRKMLEKYLKEEDFL